MNRNFLLIAHFSLLALIILNIRAEEVSTPMNNENPVRLPEVAVTETMKRSMDEKWLIGEVGNFEIFSNASETQTKNFVSKFYKFHQAFTTVFPKAGLASKGKLTFVLCDSQEKFDQLSAKHEDSTTQATASITVADNFATFQLINLDVRSVLTAGATRDERGGAFGGDSVRDSDDSVLTNSSDQVDGEVLMRREYIRMLFSSGDKPLPPWQTEGAARYFGSLKVTNKGISFGHLNAENVRFFSNNAIVPLSEMFGVKYDSPEYQQSVGAAFSEQTLLFFHFGMFADKMRWRKAFLEFLDRSAKETVTEELFRSCFKKTFSQMEYELRLYLDSGAFRHPQTPAKANLPPVPEIELRLAKDTEMGRIKGDVLRLAKRFEDARVELVSPVMRKHADAALLASLGLLDYETKNLVAARKSLEEATAANVANPAAYITLAQLRLEEALKSTPDSKLTPTQLGQVLSPLFTALSLKLSHVQIYTTIADAWLYAQTAPTQENLAILDQGVLAFPRNVDLIYKNAILKARNGFPDDARALIELGLKVSRDPDNRNRFEQLKATLPAPAAPAQK